jgi:hypothetical protein
MLFFLFDEYEYGKKKKRYIGIGSIQVEERRTDRRGKMI